MPRSAHNRQRGFTLLETLVVIAIVAMLAAVMAPNLVSTPNTRLRAAATELVSAVRATRLHALRSRTTAELEIQTRPPAYRTPDRSTLVALDPELQLQLTAAQGDIRGDSRGAIRFFPDGSSAGGRISLGNGTLLQHIDIEWLTGRAQVREQ